MAKKAATQTAPLMPAEIIEKAPPQALAKVVREAEIDTLDAQTLISTFAPAFDQASTLVLEAEKVNVTDATQVREIKRARELRLQLKDIRVGADKQRKELKEASLRKGKAIDGVFAVLRFQIEPVEDRLKGMEEFAERAEAARIEKVGTERHEALLEFGANVPVQTLGEMADDAWDAMLEGCKLQHERKQAEARKAAEAQAMEEQERAAERERLAAEQKKLAAEREKFEKAKREADAKARAEREEADRKVREAQAEADRQTKLAQQAREDVERQKREAEAAIRRQAEIEAENARRAAAAPDAEKLRAFAQIVRGLDVPAMSSEAGKEAAASLIANVGKLASWCEQKADSLT
jgi:hypothetical protein